MAESVHFDPLQAIDVADIRKTIKELSSRHLLAASSWVNEVLLSLPSHIRKSSAEAKIVEDSQEEDVIPAALASMRAHEYGRAAHFLKDATSPRARFLSIYSQFLASERAALQEFHTMDASRQQPPAPVNSSIPDLYLLVARTADPWLMFLEGLFLFRLGRKWEAITTLLNSLQFVTWNWSAWCLLSDCVDSANDFDEVTRRLPISALHPACYLWHVKIYNELMLTTYTLCDHLLQTFPHNPWLLSQKARSLAVCGFLPEAQELFESILAANPSRLDYLDFLSNILYMSANLDKLSHYASQFAHETHRPEVCVLVGQTFSFRGEHEKAIKYFTRATQLQPSFGPAYTLLGQAFNDLHNTHAAIHAYRRATSICKKDTRAWFGLGSCYRTLGMPAYALNYFKRALVVRAKDAMILEHIGLCYDELGRPSDAIATYQFAVSTLSSQHIPPTLYYKLAKLTDWLEHWEMVIQISSSNPVYGNTDYYVTSLIEAAELHMRKTGNLKQAEAYLEKAITFTSFPDEVTRANMDLQVLKTQMGL